MNYFLGKRFPTNNNLRFLRQKGLLLLCLTLTTNLFLQANNGSTQLLVETGENWLKIKATLHGMEGYQGCGETIGALVPAYKFEVYHKKTLISATNNSSEKTPCTSFARGKWIPLQQQISQTGAVTLDNMPHGQYKVVAYIGEAIGCELTADTGDYPTQSIVYRKLSSKPVYIGVRPPGYEEIVALKAKREAQRADNQAKTQQETLLYATPQLSIFPNPSTRNQVLTLELQQATITAKSVQVSIYDLQGKLVLEQELTVSDAEQNQHTWSIAFDGFATGTYLLRLTDYDDLQVEQRLVIQ